MQSQFAVLWANFYLPFPCFELGFFITLFPNFVIVLFHYPHKFPSLKLRSQALYNVLLKSL